MSHRRPLRAVAAAAIASVTALGLTATATPASAGDSPSVADILAADGREFDSNWRDFDILDQAVADVLDAKPGSAVAVLADGSVTLTAFAPTDRAFRKLVTDLTGDKPADEASTYAALATVGVDTIETVLLYHVVPGAAITYRQAKRADGARLETALGTKVRVKYRAHEKRVFLIDKDRNDRNAFVLLPYKNINKGNPQIVHGVSRVLRPIDL